MSDKPTNGVDAEDKGSEAEFDDAPATEADEDDDEDEIPVEVEDADTRPVKVPDLGAAFTQGATEYRRVMTPRNSRTARRSNARSTTMVARAELLETPEPRPIAYARTTSPSRMGRTLLAMNPIMVAEYVFDVDTGLTGSSMIFHR